MNKIWFALIIAALFTTAACTSRPSPTPEPVMAESTDTPPPPTPIEVDYPGLPLPIERGEWFSTSGACTVCHTTMKDESGADVSIDAAWRAGMMANAARDPYWQASVRFEVLSNPDLRAAIEDKCATCHMPMAHFAAAANGQEGQVLDGGFLNPEHQSQPFAIDGVSCTLCHQIEAEGLGGADSFSGGFVIDADLPSGERLNYGPYPVDDAQVTIMQGGSGFIPVQSKHMGTSEFCATCHTLYTPYVDAEGQIAGEFPEQMPYQEWSHSDYADTHTCQDCHMPMAQGGVQISITGGEPRSPFYQHTSVGSNTYMLTLLRLFGEEIEVTASSKQFEASIERTLDQLKKLTATLAFEDTGLSGSQLTADVMVETQVGHKFPTGFPSRRAWLHFTVQDASGQVIFESGAANLDGSVVGNDNDTNPANYEPHYTTIDGTDQVQIYEAIMQDTGGEVTTTLLRGASYAKDNRLLPLGFEKGSAQENIAVHGLAVDDEDFLGGGDKIRYVVDVSGAEGPFTVIVELLSQSVGYRWADNLHHHQAPEIDRFLDYYEKVPNLPVVVTHETVEVSDQR